MSDYDTGLYDPTAWYGSDYYWSGIVPVDDSPIPPRPPAQTQTRSYEEPWYVDTINRAIERAAQVATVDVGGYPPYPTFPSPTPQPYPPQGVAAQQSSGIHLSTNTLMLIVGGVLLFMLGKRGR